MKNQFLIYMLDCFKEPSWDIISMQTGGHIWSGAGRGAAPVAPRNMGELRESDQIDLTTETRKQNYLDIFCHFN